MIDEVEGAAVSEEKQSTRYERFISHPVPTPNAVWTERLTGPWAIGIFIVVVLGGSALFGLGG